MRALRNAVVVLLWLLAVAVATPAAALPSQSPASSALHPAWTGFRRFSVEHGLSQISALSFAQDAAGFMWIGTQDGLNRFDGYEFRVYRSDADDPGGLPDDRINALQIDADGTLWVGTRNGLARLDADSDRLRRVLPRQPHAARPGEEDVHVLLLGRDGRLWVGSHGGLLVVDRDGLRRLPAAPDLRIESLAEDGEGRIWVGTYAGVHVFDAQRERFQPPPRSDPALRGARIDALEVDAAGAMWIAAVGVALYRDDPAREHLQRFGAEPASPHRLASEHVRTLRRDRHGRLWIGHREGLDLVLEVGSDGLHVQRFGHRRGDPRSLGNGRVMAMFEDRTGALWIGTYNGGVSLLSAQSNRFAAVSHGLRDPVVHSLADGGDGSVWIGSRDGLYRLDRSGALQAVPGSEGLAIGEIAIDAGGMLLGASVGIARLVDGRVEPLADVIDDVATARVTSLRRIGHQLWVGTYDRGLFVLDADGRRLQAHWPTRSWVSSIDVVAPDRVLGAASDGLHWFDGSGTRIHRHASGLDAAAELPAGGVTAFLRSRDGRMWLGTAGGGVLRMHLPDDLDPRGARFEPVQTVPPLPSALLHSLVEDGAGMLWASSARGIVRIDPDRGRMVHFGAADGAFDGDYTSSSGVVLGDGRIGFGARQGLVVFDPRQILDAAAVPAPLLTELRLWNRPVAPRPDAGSLLPQPLHRLQSPLRLPAAQARMLGLRFAAPDFVAGDSLRYQYRLHGFDADWVDVAADERHATYTNLPPGQYTFHVRAAAEAHGLDDAEVSALALFILPPWWATPWARAGAMLLVALALLSLHRLRLRAALARRRELEGLVDARTRELSRAKERAEAALQQLQGAQRQLVESEKMASLGQLVAGVAHEINTPIGIAVTAASHLQERSGDIRARLHDNRLTRSELEDWNRTVDEAMQMILASLERAHALIGSFKQVAVDQSSEQRRTLDLAAFLNDVHFSLQPSWRRTGHRFEIECPPGIRMDTYPGALFRIVTNWVSNSLMHGFAGREHGMMRLQVRDLGDEVELEYSDDGIGMRPEVLARAFDPFFTTRRGSGGSGLGLHLVYNLATQLLGGRIDMSSTPAQGTRFVMRIAKIAPVPARRRSNDAPRIGAIDA